VAGFNRHFRHGQSLDDQIDAALDGTEPSHMIHTKILIPPACPAAVSLLLLAVLTGVALLTRPLIPIDETRYVSAAWEMWLRGDFLVPFKNGEPYSHKPPFMFWMFHAAGRCSASTTGGPRHGTAAVSPPACCLLTYALARRLWPPTCRPRRAGHADSVERAVLDCLFHLDPCST